MEVQQDVQGFEGWEPQWLCFTDADIRWDPRALRVAQAWAEAEGADVVGLLPALAFRSHLEAVLLAQMALALGIMFPLRHSADPARPGTVLIGGAFILVRRELYNRIGGHVSVKGCVVEDINLGRKLKAAGGVVRVAHSEGLIEAQMYNGLADLWEGLTKHAYAGVDYQWWKAVGVSLAVVVANVGPAVWAGIGAWGVAGGADGNAAVGQVAAAWVALVCGGLAWVLGERDG